MGEPNTYEAVTAYATVLTAVPASFAAYFTWLQIRPHVLIEMTERVQKPQAGSSWVDLSITLRNKRRAAILPWGIEVFGLPGAQLLGKGHVKGPNWSEPTCSFADLGTISPGSSRDYHFTLRPDWAVALESLKGDTLRWRVVVRYEDCERDRKFLQATKSSFNRGTLMRQLPTISAEAALEMAKTTRRRHVSEGGR